MNQEEDRVRKLEADIAVIKDAIRANNGFIRRVLAAPVLGGFFLAVGVGFVMLPLSWEYVLQRYAPLSAVPPGWGRSGSAFRCLNPNRE